MLLLPVLSCIPVYVEVRVPEDPPQSGVAQGNTSHIDI